MEPLSIFTHEKSQSDFDVINVKLNKNYSTNKLNYLKKMGCPME